MCVCDIYLPVYSIFCLGIPWGYPSGDLKNKPGSNASTRVTEQVTEPPWVSACSSTGTITVLWLHKHPGIRSELDPQLHYLPAIRPPSIYLNSLRGVMLAYKMVMSTGFLINLL